MSSNPRYTFGKEERLCSRKLIDSLYLSGRHFTAFPYRVQWQFCPADALPEGVRLQVLITTSKRRFRHAVDRNRVKRLTRECYRLQKPRINEWLERQGLSAILSLNYIHNEIIPFSTMTRKMEKLTGMLLHYLAGSKPIK